MQRDMRSGARQLVGKLGAAGLVLIAAPAAHAAEVDHQAWFTMNTIAERGPVTVQFDLNARVTDEVKRMSQENARATVSYRLNPAVSVGGGYFFGYSELPDVADIVEHRVFEQVQLRVGGLPKGVLLTSRTRIEQRFRQDRPGVGLRGYEMVRLQVPLAGTASLIGLVEAAQNLNSTSWGQRRGFSTARGAVSVNVPVTGHISVQPGYSGQYIKRWKAEDRFYHAYLLTVQVRV